MQISIKKLSKSDTIKSTIEFYNRRIMRLNEDEYVNNVKVNHIKDGDILIVNEEYDKYDRVYENTKRYNSTEVYDFNNSKRIVIYRETLTNIEDINNYIKENFLI